MFYTVALQRSREAIRVHPGKESGVTQARIYIIARYAREYREEAAARARGGGAKLAIEEKFSSYGESR